MMYPPASNLSHFERGKCQFWAFLSNNLRPLEKRTEDDNSPAILREVPFMIHRKRDCFADDKACPTIVIPRRRCPAKGHPRAWAEWPADNAASPARAPPKPLLSRWKKIPRPCNL